MKPRSAVNQVMVVQNRAECSDSSSDGLVVCLRVPDSLRLVARLLILWDDESQEDRAQSLPAEQHRLRRVVAAVRGAASRITSHDARSRIAAVSLAVQE